MIKKALIHDWYYINGGAEKVIHSINNIWSDFDHYALVDFLNREDREFVLNGKFTHTSFIQNLPTAKSNHRKFLQLFPYAIEQFDLQDYELIISSSASIAKGVMTNQDQLHICYCHSPMRYAWDLYYQYLNESNLNKGVKSIYAKYVFHKIRLWDILNSNRVDYFVANSHYIAKRIKKIYRRDAEVIYPPVDTNTFTIQEKKEDFYFTASRMVSYKKINLIIEAFNQMPGKKLFVAGSGPDYKSLKKDAKANIEFLGFLSDEKLKYYMKNAKAFVFAAIEDFGIVPVEAQACGTPVIGYGKGGLTETVIHSTTGVLFQKQDANNIIAAVDYFESLKFDPYVIRQHAMKFDRKRFETQFQDYVDQMYQTFKSEHHSL